ncbi:11776_t:CDS:2 [Funneliformis caledonium]|uniref:11776_t:CDS:1 n=1 Tax=Funneliformis caledonium TaxID=1117310 RepID=A0A9N8YW05_9GLOM|nr:11776_t:CDS:2 [Funneliformis caledonium]
MEAVVAEIAGQLVTGTFILVRTGAGCPKDTYCNLTQQLWTFQGEPFTPRSGISEPIQPIQFLWIRDQDRISFRTWRNISDENVLPGFTLNISRIDFVISQEKSTVTERSSVKKTLTIGINLYNATKTMHSWDRL